MVYRQPGVFQAIITVMVWLSEAGHERRAVPVVMTDEPALAEEHICVRTLETL